MAEVVIEDQAAISRSRNVWLQTIGIGAGAGILFWLLTIVLARYVVEPLVCRQLLDAAACANATPLAGNIAAVLVGAGAIFGLIRIGAARPIIITAAVTALLWDLAAWTLGLFWLEALVWSIALYALSYALFGWITRYALLWVTVVVSALIVLIIRIALAL